MRLGNFFLRLKLIISRFKFVRIPRKTSMDSLLTMQSAHFPSNALTKSSRFLPFYNQSSISLNWFPQSQAVSSSVAFEIHKSRRKSPPKSYRIKKFAEKDAFPESLPLHTKNPHAIYKDIQRFARQGKLKEALVILDYLEKEGIPVNLTTFSCLLTSCIRLKSLREGKQIHVHIRINGLEKNEFLCIKLVQMYASCGSLEDAKNIFSEIPDARVSTWNALIRGTVIDGRKNGETLNVYRKMRELGVDMNEYTFSCIIKSIAGSRSLNQGMKIHALLIKNGILNSSFILQTSIIDMYFKCSKIRLAWKLFVEIPNKDIVLWGALIAGFAHNRRQKEALDHLRWMVQEGIYPNSVILTTVLPVVGEISATKQGRELHAYVIKTKSYSKQIFIQSSLISMYSMCEDLSSARRVFYGSKERNVVCWTALISGYASNGRLDQALRSIIWMQQEGIKPDEVSIATVLPVCGQLKALTQGKEIHGYAIKNGFLPNVSISTSLMIMYSKCGNLQSSCNVFDSMEKKNVISWTAMIDSYMQNGFLQETLKVFRLMQSSKHRPDSVSMARMLCVCRELGSLKLGKEIHGQILKKDLFNIPFISAALMEVYGRCKEIEKAKLVFNSVEVKGTITWTALIKAHEHSERYQEAIDIFYRMQRESFDPNHFTFDVVLSICNEAGFADEGLKILGPWQESFASRFLNYITLSLLTFLIVLVNLMRQKGSNI